ncbi:MAG: DUF4097 family beta strand repeat protein [Candidatus Eisenbacteria bacterium]|uniref:DUF4097 family beta strand repeat protein n=1 Tax=Eiseniibacteriota bacterium TaxID=2212470 RepID=A0A7Y2E9F9_UNCEI|nr:DUF4097 family beta strand repeat protein [Candidatus Eisenbacteria bacterium]
MRSILALALMVVLSVALVPTSQAATATYTDTQDFSLDGPGLVEVDASIHDIYITRGSGSEVVVKVTMEVKSSSKEKAEDYIENHKPTYDQRGNDIIIDARSKKKNWWKKFNWKKFEAKSRIDIEVPKGTELVLDTASGDLSVRADLGDVPVSCNTASGDIELDGSATNLRMGTASGDIDVSISNTAESMDLSTASGDIMVRGSTHEANISTASGTIEVDGLRGDANLSTASGDVVAAWDQVDTSNEIEISTASGDVDVYLPESIEIDGFASTVSGRIRSDFGGKSNKRRSQVHFDGGRDALFLEVDTASGDISIRRR